MPNRPEKMPVEDFKLTKEQKAFYKVFSKFNVVQKMLGKGIQVQQGKLEAMRAMAEDVEGKKKQLLLNAPDQSTLDSADEGMVEMSPGKYGSGMTMPQPRMQGMGMGQAQGIGGNGL